MLWSDGMYIYLVLNILIIIFPLLLSFEKRIRFWKNWRALLGSVIPVGIIFIAWDIYATEQGHWSFNEKYLIGLKLFGLPLEEIVFFITVPYACLFTYEALRYYIKEWKVPYKPWPYAMFGIILISAGFAFWHQGYTLLVLIQTGLLLLVMPLIARSILASRTFWAYLLVTMVLFIIFNMVLTAVPIVRYDPDHIWGGDGAWNGRFFTIPLEDFFYSITMLTWCLILYRKIGKAFERKEETSSPING